MRFTMLNIRLISFLVFILLTLNMDAQVKAEEDVKKLLNQQVMDWNKGDIPAFMEGYWKSDKLQFIGSKGVTYGWQNTLDNYKKGYPDKAAMGHLAFELLEVDKHSRKIVMVSGKFILTRESGEVLDGHFLLLVKKIKGKWKVIADHTS